MLRTLFVWLFAGLFVLSASPAVAGPKGEKRAAKRAVKKAEKKAAREGARKAVKTAKRKHRKKIKLRRAMRRTNAAIRHARVVVKKGSAGKGSLRAAVHHQRAARAARQAGKRVVALHLTRSSRAAARAAIAANKGEKVPAELTPDDEVEIEGDPDQPAIDGFLKGAEAGLPDEAAIVADETLGADAADEIGDEDPSPAVTPVK